MNPRHLVAACLAALLTSAAGLVVGFRLGQNQRPADPVTAERSAALDAERASLRQTEQRLTREVDDARASVRRLLDEATAVAATQPGLDWPRTLSQPDRSALNAIELPADPTAAQARKYVRQIVTASREQTTHSMADPQVGMLMQVARRHLDVLLNEAGSHQYVVWAVGRAATDADKKAIIAAMRSEPALVEVVRDRHWEDDARKELIAGLRGRPNYLPTQWIDAVASFKDPATYPLLRDYLARGLNPSWTYKAIEPLPGVDANEWVSYAWRQRQPGLFGILGGSTYMDDLAPVAAKCGHRDAFDHLIKMLADTASPAWRRDAATAGVTEASDARGTPVEISKWYEANKGRLTFDATTGRFVVGPETRPATAPATAPASTEQATID